MTRPSPKLDAFADLLADGLTVSQASAQMHMPTKRGDRYLEDIRKRLGSQAR